MGKESYCIPTHKMKKVRFVLTIFLFMFATAVMAQDDAMKGPWQAPGLNAARQEGEKDASNPGTSLVKFYRKYLSPVAGGRCPMYPSCSQYSIECFSKHGLLMGWIMTWDRLYRCGRDELGRSPWVFVNGRQKCYDPVKNNDFWWSDGR